MLSRVCQAPAARAVALLVAVALSGAPRVAGALAPPARHLCRCTEHGPEQPCTCPICRRAAAAAMAGDPTAPPCHRARARAELAGADHPATPPDAPCLTGSCGALDPRPATVTGVEPFVLPAPPRSAAPSFALPLAAPAAPHPSLAPEPEIPPPRRAARPGVAPSRPDAPARTAAHPSAPRAAR